MLSSPSFPAAPLGTQPARALGTITDGPFVANGLEWWAIDYDTGADGWSNETTIVEAYFPPPESAGGWRSLVSRGTAPSAEEKALIRETIGLDWDKLKLASDYSDTLSSSSAVLVIRNGWIAGEWGIRRDVKVASVTKSLTGLALAKLLELSSAGLLPIPIDPESLVYQYLPPEFGDSDPLKRELKLKHFMTMSSGIASADNVAFNLTLDEALTYPMSANPGQRWSYVSLPVNLLSIIVQQLSGESLQSFFNNHIAGPIGAPIASWGTWAGYTAGGGKASLNARNLARIGYLALRQGQWNDGGGVKQIISADSLSFVTNWASSLSTVTSFETAPPFFAPDPESQHYYGHLFWTNRNHYSLGASVPADAYYMHGFKDTLCVVIPSLDMVIVRLATSGPGTDPSFRAEFVSRVVAAVVSRPGSNPASLPKQTVDADFDGDGKSDVGVYGNGAWSVLHSSNAGITVKQWGGLPQDRAMSEDFDGDGKADHTVYRDGGWHVLRSSDGGQSSIGLGGAVQDIPVPADYDGDGKADFAVYRDGGWHVLRSSDGGQSSIGWGGAVQDIPVPADYDGDRKADIAVYRDGGWHVLRSSDGGQSSIGWGGAVQDVPVPADYDGDGKADIAVYRDGVWFVIHSSNGEHSAMHWGGLPQDIPMALDFDGDGKTDRAVYRGGTWFILRSSNSEGVALGWGGSPDDVPLK